MIRIGTCSFADEALAKGSLAELELPFVQMALMDGRYHLSIDDILRAAHENGIDFFDTARAYTDSEEKLGEALEQHLRNYQMEVIRQGMPPLPIPEILRVSSSASPGTCFWEDTMNAPRGPMSIWRSTVSPCSIRPTSPT